MMSEESNDTIYTIKQPSNYSSLSINPELSKAFLCYGQYYYTRGQPLKNSVQTENNTNVPPIKLPNNQNKQNMSSTLPNKSIQQLKSLVVEKNLFKDTIWDSIQRYHPPKKCGTPQVTVELHKEAWIKACNESWCDDALPIIPINNNYSDNNNPSFHIKIIKICSVNAYIAIGIEYDTISKFLLHAIYAKYCGDTRIPQDILKIIIDFYTICQPSAIYLDKHYIENQLSNSNLVDLSRFKPFISNLVISNNSESEQGEPMSAS